MVIACLALTALLFLGLAFYSLKFRYLEPFKQPIDFGAVMPTLHWLYVLSWNVTVVIILWKVSFPSALFFGILAFAAQRLLFRVALGRAITARARELNIEREAAAAIIRAEMKPETLTRNTLPSPA